MSRVPLVYPKIAGSGGNSRGPCLFFEKIDGTNIHWAWTPGVGFHTFGLRRRQYPLDEAGKMEFERNHFELREALPEFEKIKALLEARLIEDEWDKDVIIFTEFVGEHSFAGQHKTRDQKELVIIDAFVDGHPMFPELFVDAFKGMNIPKVIYRGKVSGRIIDDVRQGSFDVDEGVVIKGVYKCKVWMMKVKTDAYQARLKKEYGNKWSDYWE